MAQRFRILVADRNPNVRELLQRELGRDGFEVEVAGSGEAVNSMIYGHMPPDLLILDLDLPYAGEVALLERIRARRPQIPIIIHTFLAENSEREADGGTRTYIEKNGNMDILKDAVRGMLARFYPDRFLALSDADADRGPSRKRTGEDG